MSEPVQGRMSVNPPEAVRRQAAAWHGLDAEIVQLTGEGPFEYHCRAPMHLFTVCERAVRSDGETAIDGLAPSHLRDLGGKMCFVPAGHAFRGSFVPRILLRATHFYIDAHKLPIDPDLGFAETALSPLLFFEDAALRATALKLNALVENPAAANSLYADALSTVLAIELMRVQTGRPFSLPPIKGGLAARQQRVVRDYIREHLAEDVSLQDLASLAGLSPTHFSRAFKQSFGASPQRYQLQCRIEHAKTLLTDRSRTLMEIGLSSGFGFPSNFSHAFRRVTGTTPSEFRRALT